MPVAELTAEGWTAVIGAIGTAAVAIFGGIGAAFYKLRVDDNKTKLELAKVQATADKGGKSSKIEQLEEAIQAIARERQEDRDEVHKLRGECHDYAMKAVAAETMNRATEQRLSVCERRLDACEAERAELKDRVRDLSEGDRGK